MINKELVKDLDEDILLQAIAIFIKNAENDLGGLQLAFDRSNTPQVKRISHKLAGSSISVGLEKFHQLAKEIENKEEEITLSDIEALTAAFEEIKTFFRP